MHCFEATRFCFGRQRLKGGKISFSITCWIFSCTRGGTECASSGCCNQSCGKDIGCRIFCASDITATWKCPTTLKRRSSCLRTLNFSSSTCQDFGRPIQAHDVKKRLDSPWPFSLRFLCWPMCSRCLLPFLMGSGKIQLIYVISVLQNNMVSVCSNPAWLGAVVDWMGVAKLYINVSKCFRTEFNFRRNLAAKGMIVCGSEFRSRHPCISLFRLFKKKSKSWIERQQGRTVF